MTSLVVLENVGARRAPLALADLTLALGPGVHAFVGTRDDGASALVELLGGVWRPARGTVRVLGGAPTDWAVRRRVARVGLDYALPAGLRVDEVLRLASRIRGEAARDASERLAVLGLEALARRPVRTLTPAEARAVGAAEALTSAVVRAIWIEEPLVGMDPRAAARLVDVLPRWTKNTDTGDATADGKIVVVTTASPRDAGALGTVVASLRRGTLQRVAAGAPPPALVVYVADDDAARRLTAGLARDPAVATLAHEGTCVRVGGDDAADVARAVTTVAIRESVEVVEIACERPGAAAPWGAAERGVLRTSQVGSGAPAGPERA